MRLKSNIAILCLLTCAIFADSRGLAEPGYREIQTIAQKPDLSQAIVTERDLPPGFKESSPAELAQTKKDLSSEGVAVEIESVFELKNFLKGDITQLQSIMGYTTLVPGFMSENYVRHDAKNLMRGLIREMENVPREIRGLNLGTLQPQPLTNLDGIGDVSAGITTSLNIMGFRMRMDMVVFQRGRVVGKVMVHYLDSSRPGVSAADIARKLDSRIVQLAR